MFSTKKISTHLLLQLALIIAIALVGFSPAVATAQINPEIANCSEMKDDATQTQAEICSAHPGCKLVFAIHKTCVKAKQFINNLRTAIGDGVQGFFGRNKDITPDAIFEASLPTKTRALSTVPEVKDMAAGIRNEVRNVRGEVLKGTGEGNVDWVYYGQVKDGKAEGTGTRMYSDGSLARGSFNDNELHGNGETILKGESRYISEFDKRLRTGKGAFANESGTSFVGTFEKNNMKEGTFITAAGFRFEGTFQNNNISQGRLLVDGKIREEGQFLEDGKLSIGKSYDASGNATAVNLPVERQVAAAAAREAEARNRRDADVNRQAAEQRKRDGEARVAQAFKDSLGTMNPGQLFAKADELSAQGDKVRAREALRALVSRYPDHALAGSAAQQLSGGASAIPVTQSQGRSTRESRKQASPQRLKCFPSDADIAELERLSALIPGGKRSSVRGRLESHHDFFSIEPAKQNPAYVSATLNAWQGNIGHYEFKMKPNFSSDAREDDRYRLFETKVSLKMADCYLKNPDPSEVSNAASQSGTCAQRAEAAEAEFGRRIKTIASDNRIGQLGMIYSISKTVSDIWKPCNPAKAQSYQDTADATLRTCSAIATTPSVCTPNISW